MATIVEQVKAVLGVDVEPGTQKTLDDMEDSVDGLIKGFGKVATAVVGATAALVTATTITNKHTSVQTNLANALGISAERAETFGFLLGQIGLSGESVIKTMRVMNDRIGELAQGAKAPETMRRAVKALGLETNKLIKLAPGEQFEVILQAAQDAENGQIAMAAATELLGREGVKLTGWVRNQSKSVAELLELQRQLNLQTDEGRSGAMRMTAAMDNLGAVTESIWKLFSGLVGEALAPAVEWFNELVAANRELIQQKVKEWALAFGKFVEWLVPKIVWLATKIRELWQRFDRFVKSTVGWKRLLKLLGIAFTAMMAALGSAVILKAALSIMKLGKAIKALWLGAMKPVLLLAAIALVLEDIYTFLEGGRSVTGLLLRQAEEWLGIDIVEPIRAAWPEVKQFIVDFGRMFKAYMTGLLQSLFGFVKLNLDVLGSILKFFVEVFSKGFDDAWANLIQRLSNAWGSFAMNFVETWKGAINQVWDLIKPLVDFAKDVGASVASVFGVETGTPVARNDFMSRRPSEPAAQLRSGTVNTSEAKIDVGGININPPPGSSPANIAAAVKDALGGFVADAKRANSSGVAY